MVGESNLKSEHFVKCHHGQVFGSCGFPSGDKVQCLVVDYF